MVGAFVLLQSVAVLAATPTEVLDLMKRQALRTARGGHSGNAYPDTTHQAPVTGLNTWINRNGWTMGFFPGYLWQLYDVTKDNEIKNLALNWTEGIKPEENNTGTHDLGFMVYDSLGIGYEVAKISGYKDVILKAAKSLATRYNSKVGAIQSWGAGNHCRLDKSYRCNFPVIIDNMMNLELLFFSANNGGPATHRDIAIAHAEKTMKYHIRSDGSTFHVVDYNTQTGAVSKQCTAQGYKDDSTWTRGQAWCLYGFTQVYRYTKDKRFLDTAVKCANFFVRATGPKDGVPLWDFKWDGAQELYNRDSSAAAVAASGLVELATYVDQTLAQEYTTRVKLMINSLSDKTYLGNFDQTQGVLIHATTTGAYRDNATFAGSNVDVSLPYADYYFLEALRRLHAV